MNSDSKPIQFTVYGNTYPYRQKLKKDGFRWNPQDKVWQKTISKETVPTVLTLWGKRTRLNVSTNEPEYCRSADYRQTFLSHYSGLPLRCAYCGTRVYPFATGRHQLTVDHVISVWSVNGSPDSLHYREKMTRYGIADVNDIHNLVSACPDCNRHKGRKYRRRYVFQARLWQKRMSHRENSRQVFNNR